MPAASELVAFTRPRKRREVFVSDFAWNRLKAAALSLCVEDPPNDAELDGYLRDDAIEMAIMDFAQYASDDPLRARIRIGDLTKAATNIADAASASS